MGAAAVVVFSVALSAAGGHRSSFAVAARYLPAGTVIGPGDIGTASLSLTSSAAAGAFRNPGDLIGRTVTVPVGPGQLMESALLTGTAGAGRRPVSVAVDGNSLASLAPGDAVDVLAFAGQDSASGDATSGSSSASAAIPPQGGAIVVMRDATLLSIDRSSSGLLGGPGTGGSVVVTLGVGDLSEVEAVVAAAHAGTVELVQAEPADGSGPGSGTADPADGSVPGSGTGGG